MQNFMISVRTPEWTPKHLQGKARAIALVGDNTETYTFSQQVIRLRSELNVATNAITHGKLDVVMLGSPERVTKYNLTNSTDHAKQVDNMLRMFQDNEDIALSRGEVDFKETFLRNHIDDTMEKLIAKAKDPVRVFGFPIGGVDQELALRLSELEKTWKKVSDQRYTFGSNEMNADVKLARTVEQTKAMLGQIDALVSKNPQVAAEFDRMSGPWRNAEISMRTNIVDEAKPGEITLTTKSTYADIVKWIGATSSVERFKNISFSDQTPSSAALVAEGLRAQNEVSARIGGEAPTDGTPMGTTATTNATGNTTATNTTVSSAAPRSATPVQQLAAAQANLAAAQAGLVVTPLTLQDVQTRIAQGDTPDNQQTIFNQLNTIHATQPIANFQPNPAVVSQFKAAYGDAINEDDLARRIIDQWNVERSVDNITNPNVVAQAKSYARAIMHPEEQQAINQAQAQVDAARLAVVGEVAGRLQVAVPVDMTTVPLASLTQVHNAQTEAINAIVAYEALAASNLPFATEHQQALAATQRYADLIHSLAPSTAAAPAAADILADIINTRGKYIND